MRIAVVGAGIVGVHVALELVQRGAEVTLIEARGPGGGTTAGSLAWIDASHPGIADYLELRLLGVRAWRRQAEELGRPKWLSLPGTVIWTCDPNEAARLAAHAGRLSELGERVEHVGVRAALQSEADLVVPPDVEAVYRFPGEGWIEAAAAIAALLERGRVTGLQLRSGTEVRALEVNASGRIAGLTLASCERITTDVVVSCVGRWTGSLLAAAGIAVPMLEPGQAAGRVAGGVSGAVQARVDEAWVCLRAIPADLLPVVGWAADGLYVVTSHSGVTLAPALAELVASELLDGANRAELTRFRPARFRSVLT